MEVRSCPPPDPIALHPFSVPLSQLGADGGTGREEAGKEAGCFKPLSLLFSFIPITTPIYNQNITYIISYHRVILSLE